MAEQYRVAWDDRAAYLTVLADLKRAIDREQDAVQVGGRQTDRFGGLLAEVHQARGVYACKVTEMAQQHPPQPE